MKKELTAALLAASMLLMTGCVSSKPISSVTISTEETTVETTTETTTEATTTTTTEATTTTTAETTPEQESEKLNMTIDEVVKAIIKESNCGFKLDPLSNPKSKEFFEKPMLKKQKKIGILNHRTVSYFYEDMKHYDNSITVIVDIYEFDMESKQYKAIKENKGFKAYQVLGYGKKAAADKIDCIASAVNKQYVVYIQGSTGNNDNKEEKAPFKNSQASKDYYAFKNLK
jgi:hypothetical protein